jgi:hypothetical protein
MSKTIYIKKNAWVLQNAKRKKSRIQGPTFHKFRSATISPINPSPAWLVGEVQGSKKRKKKKGKFKSVLNEKKKNEGKLGTKSARNEHLIVIIWKIEEWYHNRESEPEIAKLVDKRGKN